MAKKPTYEELEQRVKELEKQQTKYKKQEAISPDLFKIIEGYLERTQIGIYHYDIECRTVAFSNPYFAKLLGEEIDGEIIVTPETIKSKLDKESIRIVKKAVVESMKPGCKKGQVEYKLQHPDGTLHWMRDDWIIIRDERDNAIAFEGVLRDITERKQAEEQRNRLVSDLQKTLSEVKTLRGFLPICSHCKNIRDDKGYWNQIESYIHKHSDAEFSHGICPECMKKHYPEYYDDEE